ncbi:tRNA-dihydrouridine synthase family protein [Candidatus Woesearchaeota archaeon]|nr:tRNA-dihydrouridine synthase family protein [Candidatus Woesearchaeota archaeon]
MNKFLFGRLWLSPMEGVSDLGFRTICNDSGASLTFTEMIRASSLVQGNKATLSLVDTFTHSPPTGIQLLVNKKEILQKALAMIREGIETKDGRFSNLSVIDLNFGCPSPEIIQIGQGPAMLKRITRMKELLTVLRKESPLPCGIKIRLGLNDREKKEKIYLRILEIANDLGLDYLTVHPKTAADSSLAPIDWKALEEIISHAKIPIMGNGFVVDGPSARKMLDAGCKAVMIARASVGNPHIFSEIETFLTTGRKIAPANPSDYQAAWKRYSSIATRYGTNKKYYEYHQKMFELRMKGDQGYHSPLRILKWV